MSTPRSNKRQKEQVRQERQQDKAARRQQRRIDHAERKPKEDGVDSDIAGIVPGPQPPEDASSKDQE
jgi:hypothetical protein